MEHIGNKGAGVARAKRMQGIFANRETAFLDGGNAALQRLYLSLIV